VATDVEELYLETLTYLEKWELEKAEENLRKILDLDPDHARAWNKLGVVFARRKDLRQAEDCFNLAVQKDPNLASPHSNLGNIYAERGWIDRAQTAYEQALVLDPGNPTATHNLGVLYRKSGDIGRGVDLMKQATRSERGRYKSELRSSPETRRIVRTGWIIVLAIGAILLFLLNR
jgi:Flp pilus assembly protein TadD